MKKSLIYETYDGRIFTNREEAYQHEKEIELKYLSELGIELTKDFLYDKRQYIIENGEEAKRYGYPAYIVDERNYAYTDGEGYIIGVVFKGVALEDYSIHEPVRYIINQTEDIVNWLNQQWSTH